MLKIKEFLWPMPDERLTNQDADHAALVADRIIAEMQKDSLYVGCMVLKWVSRLTLVVTIGCSAMSGKGSESTDLKQEHVAPYVSEGLTRAQLQDQAVLDAMSRVPRHKFVPERQMSNAYDDRALPIGAGQTISQPFIVALMTQEAHVGTGSRVLEIGTGSGYQAAVLAELGASVYSIEIVPELAERAQATLKEIGYTNITVKTGDGWQGWQEHAPFDVILITAASPKIPLELLSQLADGGHLIVPLENSGAEGEALMLYERRGYDIISRNLGPVKFVPLTGAVRTPVDPNLSEGFVLDQLKGRNN